MTGVKLPQKIKANWTTFWTELMLFPKIVPWMPGLLAPLSWRQPDRLKRIVAAITQDMKTIIKGIIRGLYWLGGEQHPSVATEPLQTKADELHEQVVRTYSNLRYGLAVISFALPLFLWFIGESWYGVSQQNSMSAYYFAEPNSNSVGAIRSWITSLDIIPSQLFALGGFDRKTPLRSWFVGMLFVLGIFLYLYKGFSWQENVYLNVAGLSALGVALFPMEWECGQNCRPYTFHGIFAIVAFVAIALVALLCANDTLRKVPPTDKMKTKAYRWWYILLGVVMLVFPFAAWGITTWLNPYKGKFLFFAEWFGLSIFALYWWIKSNELSETRAEEVAIADPLKLASEPPAQPDINAVPAQPVGTKGSTATGETPA